MRFGTVITTSYKFGKKAFLLTLFWQAYAWNVPITRRPWYIWIILGHTSVHLRHSSFIFLHASIRSAEINLYKNWSLEFWFKLRARQPKKLILRPSSWSRSCFSHWRCSLTNYRRCLARALHISFLSSLCLLNTYFTPKTKKRLSALKFWVERFWRSAKKWLEVPESQVDSALSRTTLF